LVAVIDVLRGLTAVEDGQLFKAVLAESPSFVRGELARLLPELDEPREDTEGPGGWDDWRRQRLFDALRQTLAASSQFRPVAVVIEDLHWADPSTLDLIDYLLARGHGTGVPLVLTYRAEDEDTDPAGGEWLTRAVRNDRVHRLDLGALTRAETAEQIGLLMGRQPTTSLVEEIYARSEGNPFFTDQLVAALASTDGPPTLPGGLRGLLLDRIGHVEEAQRQVLAALAIAERGLDEPALTRVCGTPRDVVRDSLRDLAARRLLRRPDAAGRHSLRHALLGDVVADILLPSERAEMHRRIARLLAGWNEPELAADIAEHYAGAGLTAEELRWRVAAGQRADAVYASAEAARHWLRAVRLSESLSAGDRVDGLSLAEMYGAAVDALAAAGSEETAHALSEEALDRLGGTDDENAAEVLRRAGQMRGISEPSRGLELLGRALAIYDRRPPSADQVRTLRDMLDILVNEGRPEEAAAALARALHLAAQAELRDFGLELGAIGAQNQLLAAGRSDEALQQIRDISGQLTPDDDAELQVRVAIMHSSIVFNCGLEHEVEAVAAPALQIAADRGMAHSVLTTILRWNLFEALVDLGRIDAAARLIDPVSQDEPGVSARNNYQARAYLEMLRGNHRRRTTPLDRAARSSARPTGLARVHCPVGGRDIALGWRCGRCRERIARLTERDPRSDGWSVDRQRAAPCCWRPSQRRRALVRRPGRPGAGRSRPRGATPRGATSGRGQYCLPRDGPRSVRARAAATARARKRGDVAGRVEPPAWRLRQLPVGSRGGGVGRHEPPPPSRLCLLPTSRGPAQPTGWQEAGRRVAAGSRRASRAPRTSEACDPGHGTARRRRPHSTIRNSDPAHGGAHPAIRSH
jgi:hypothetical protein